MSSRPFGPQDFGVIRIRNYRFRRHREPWSPIWLLAGAASLSITVLSGLVWWLTAPPPTSLSAQATDQRVAGAAVRSATMPPDHGASESSKLSLRTIPDDRRLLARADSNGRGAARSTNAATMVTASGLGRSVPAAVPDLREIYESIDPIHGRNAVDDDVFRKLIALGIKPAKLCSDEVFLRRVYIDVLGTLPTVDEARSFLDNHQEDKRKTLIDELLQRPEFADYWAMKWCDVLRVKAEFPVNLWPAAAQAYHRWIRRSLHNNLPYDRFARALLTSSGSNFRTPQVNFYRALESKEPEAISHVVALTFLGERTDHWPQSKRVGVGKFFSKVGYKPTGEWKEEIVFFDPRRNGADPNQAVGALYPSGVSVTIPPDQDPREVFADWLTDRRNPWFARAVTNRIWYWLVGRGIVDPPDDVRHDNPPANLPLLNTLARQLIESDYDMKHVFRLILNSSAYQMSCIPQSDDHAAATHFAYYPTRRLDAEVLIDAICQITGTTETYMSIIPEPFTFLPDHHRAIRLPDGSITSSFLEMFGRPARDTGLVSERNNRLTASQALHLLNSNHIRNKIDRGPGIRSLVSQGRDRWDTAERIYLAVLSRRPNENELTTAGALCDDPSGAQELAWILINSDEFLFRH
ncbi:hypothetical protein Mal15_50670 [Stieleria maiorica]|uniref:DUF1553 domain-containing protein n=1 Tax=Stieleria maiorica TaxID=2795974 RepID=A0A5B9MLV4_9BACT|nr:DUF1553 domain-containing protein [Stieleria maiorica]QEG00991.1 hypothetical protein Mal15_50670 [Stieleria maiorica]